MIDLLKKMNIGTILPYVLLSLMFMNMMNNQKQSADEAIKFNNALRDSVQVKIDKYRDRVYEISQLRTQTPKIFLDLKTDDKTILKLQAEVEKYKNQIKEGSSVTIFSTGTQIDTTLSVKHNEDGSLSAHATDGKWYSVNNRIDERGVSTTSLQVNNDYSVAVVEEGDKDVVKITNNNPYSTEGEIRAYTNLPKRDKKVSVGVGLGYSPIDGTIKPELQLQYKLLNLW